MWCLAPALFLNKVSNKKNVFRHAINLGEGATAPLLDATGCKIYVV